MTSERDANKVLEKAKTKLNYIGGVGVNLTSKVNFFLYSMIKNLNHTYNINIEEYADN